MQLIKPRLRPKGMFRQSRLWQFNYLQQQQMQQTNVSKEVLPPRAGVQMKKLNMVLSIISLFTITRYNHSPPWPGIILTGLAFVTLTARCPDAVRTVRSLAARRCHRLLKIILCCKEHETADSSISEWCQWLDSQSCALSFKHFAVVDHRHSQFNRPCSRHPPFCTHFNTDGIKTMSRGFSEGK